MTERYLNDDSVAVDMYRDMYVTGYVQGQAFQKVILV